VLRSRIDSRIMVGLGRRRCWLHSRRNEVAEWRCLRSTTSYSRGTEDEDEDEDEDVAVVVVVVGRNAVDVDAG
jgi:hypothetical protein